MGFTLRDLKPHLFTGPQWSLSSQDDHTKNCQTEICKKIYNNHSPLQLEEQENHLSLNNEQSSPIISILSSTTRVGHIMEEERWAQPAAATATQLHWWHSSSHKKKKSQASSCIVMPLPFCFTTVRQPGWLMLHIKLRQVLRTGVHLFTKYFKITVCHQISPFV